MGLFSRDCFEQYRREVRIMWRVLAVAGLVAAGVHAFSLPFVARFTAGLVGDPEPDIAATPIEIVVEEELQQQTSEPETDPEDQPEPAAAAQQPSPPPLATAAQPVSASDVAAADTVAVQQAIATENGSIVGQGAVGGSTAIGLVRGSGTPVEEGDRINLPDINLPEVSSPTELSRPRASVPEVSLAARRRPSSRSVSCNPCSVPDYPLTARRAEIEGQPVINAIFDESGRVVEAVIERSSGNAAFDQAALEEARSNWRFDDPRQIGGQVSVDVIFVVEGSEQYGQAQQAGEVRTVELPVNQQIRPVVPNQTTGGPAANGAAPDSEGNRPAEPSTATDVPASQSPESASDETAAEAGSDSGPIHSSSPSATPVDNRPDTSAAAESPEPAAAAAPQVMPVPQRSDLSTPPARPVSPTTALPVAAPPTMSAPVTPRPVAAPTPTPQPTSAYSESASTSAPESIDE
ncbi:MAG: TonB family protein [Cyanobacteria bacterium J06632_22]